MVNIRKMSPMVRSIGTMGVVAGLVGAVTFANLTSNAVAFGPNDVQTATASLAIETTGCSSESTGTLIPGFSVTGLVPGGAGSSINFCLANTGDVPMAITGSIPQNLTASVAALHTNLSINCPGLGTLSANLNSWGPGTFTNPLAAGNTTNCTATVLLDSGYTGSGGESIPTFGVYFNGTQVIL